MHRSDRPAASRREEALATAPVLRRLGLDVLRDVAARSATRAVIADTDLTSGRGRTFLWVVLEGRLAAIDGTTEGMNLELFTCGPSELMGEEVLITDDPMGGVRARLAGTVIEIPAGVLRRAVMCSPEAMLDLTDLLVRRRRQVQQRLAEIAAPSVRARLIAVITRLGRATGIPDGGGVLLRDRLTHEQLAELIGPTRESVSRAMKSLTRDRVLTVCERRIILLPPCRGGGSS